MKRIAILLMSLLLMNSCNRPLPEMKGELRHVVTFKFIPEATKDQVNRLIEDFAGLQQQIDLVKSLEWGLNVSPEGYDKGMTHVFLLTFKNEKDRDLYLIHPAHVAFGRKHGQLIEDSVVVDYKAE
ncbi:Dabb family protein [Roseivirga sp. UBA1976]|uniref:Dabb family protein n=1 Tax=Roseivirga sp. UBA1976 TaxID=1947386 RepID=UPI00257FA43B|nr:Dabb family protein [Roseivirga sp. UBA1976]